MDTFKMGDEVWFEYEISGHSYERCGFILDGPSDNGFYIIRNAKDSVDFYIHKDKIHYERPDKRIKELEEAYSKAEAMCDNSEPVDKCHSCKYRELSSKDWPCYNCYKHSNWESTKVNPFKLGDLVMYKDASKPEVFTVIEIIEFKDPIGHNSCSYRIKRTDKDGQDIVNLVDHDRLEKVDKQYTGGYIYPVGAHVRFEYRGKELIGDVEEIYQDYVSKKYGYRIHVDDKFYVIKPDSILGYAANWIDDPSIRKAFGLDIKNDIYENIKKQINKDQLNFHYGLSSIFKLAPNDAAVPSELSGLDINQTFYDDILKWVNEDKMSINDIRKKIGMKPIKEDNKMKKEQKKRNRNIIKTEKSQRTIKDITFNGPAVIVKFEPSEEDLVWGRFKGDKVVVVCKDSDKYDMKTGFLLAILKEFLNNQSYGNILEKLDSFDALDIPQVGKDEVRK